MPRRKKDSTLDLLQKELKEVLEKPGLTPSERLKAIETGAKLLMIRHKLEDGVDKEGSFFGRK